MIKELTFAMLKEKDGGEHLQRLLATRVKTKWPYKVWYDFRSYTTTEVEDWCEENCVGPFNINPSYIHFGNDKDATLAKLKWSYNDQT